MEKQNILIVGSSGHAKVIIDIFEKGNTYIIKGLLDAFRSPGEETMGYTILGSEINLPALLKEDSQCKVFVAIGDNWIRQTVVNKIFELVPDVEFATAIHPSVQIGKNTKIGKGVAIMAGAIINSNSMIGDFAIINTKASVDHDNQLSKFCSLAPNATTGGNVSIGEYSAISISATVKNGIKVGNHSIIGAGAILLKNCGDNEIMFGIPAKPIRQREVGERYL